MSDLATRRYIHKETAIAIAVNIVFSLLFYLLVFQLRSSIPIWRGMGLAVDMLPQAFMIGLMSALVPGLLTGKRVRSGAAILRLDGRSRQPRHLIARSIVVALGSMVLFGGGAIVLLSVSGLQTMAFAIALPLKMAFGGVEAWFVTPFALRATILHAASPLSQPA